VGAAQEQELAVRPVGAAPDFGPSSGWAGDPAIGAHGRPLTIVMVAACPFPARRGTPVRIQRLSERLAALGHRVHVVTYHHGSSDVDPALAVHRTPSVPFYRKLSPGPTYAKLALLDPLLTLTLSRVLRRERVDVVHAHHFEGLLVASAARRGAKIPIVFDAHTMLSSELQYYDLWLPTRAKRAIAGLLDRQLPRRADHVATVTQRIRDKLLALGAMPAERITVVPNGVEFELFDLPDPAAVRGNHPPTLIFTGNLAAYQGIELMLAAFQKVRERRPEVRLTIVSDSPFERYAAMARALGVADGIDIVSAPFAEVPRLLARADVAVNPRTDADGVPVKLLNFMAASKPIVSFAGSAPGMRHLETGWLADDNDVAGFAEGALALLADPLLAARLGRAARQFVEREHSWTQSAIACESIYHELLRARAGSRS
jgi:glycosyltransferase involved in cell wall biosynthesis